MPLTEEKLNKFKELLKMADDGLTRQEFLDSFRNVINIILKREKLANEQLNQALSDIKALFSELNDKTKQYTESEVKDAVNALRGKVEKAMKLEEGLMNQIRDKIRSVKDGVKGDKGEPGKNGRDGRNGSPDTADQILNKISGLLEITDIKNLKETLDELRKIREERRLFGGGGFSKMAMDYRILDPYTPTGTINGVNCDFTLTKTPNPATSLKIYRGGAKQQLNPTGTTDGDYSLNGKTITFNIAPVVGEVIEAEHRI